MAKTKSGQMSLGFDADVAKLRKGLQRASKEVRAAVKKYDQKIGQEIVDLAAPNIPVRSGALKRSTRSVPSSKGVKVRTGGTAKTRYGGAIHWGRKWIKRNGKKYSAPIPRRSYLWDAVQTMYRRDDFAESYTKSVRETMESAGFDFSGSSESAQFIRGEIKKFSPKPGAKPRKPKPYRPKPVTTIQFNVGNQGPIKR